jgi:AhpD family alkylhydroperoxidase
MNTLASTLTKGLILSFALIFANMVVAAQDNGDYEGAKSEITTEFGMIPSHFAAYPKHALAGAWENYKQINSGNGVIDAKTRELIGLVVASQIPCVYCVYFHKGAAKANSATDEEIKEAIAIGAQTRHWSMIIQGSEIPFEEFKAESEKISNYMSEKSKK